MGAGLPGQRLHRTLLRLHPRSFRERFGAASDRLFVDWVGSAASAPERRRRGRQAVREASVTLAQAWGAEMAHRSGRLGLAASGLLALARRGFGAGFRSVRTRPGQALTVVLTVAIAVGANAALFSVARTLLLRPLPYRDAGRLVSVQGGTVVEFEGRSFRLKEAFATLPGLEATTSFAQGGSANMAGDVEATRVRLAQVPPGFFGVLGAEPVLGRGILDSDEGEAVTVLSHALWRQSFASAPGVIGETLTLNERTYTIVGVAAPEVDFPAGTQAWLPMPFELDFYGNAFGGDAVARLQPGADLRALNNLLAARFEQSGEPAKSQVPPPLLVPLRGFLLRDVSAALYTLTGAAALVLLLGGLNLAGLWSSQVAERVDELRLRRALGAARSRILVDLIAENAVVALLGGFVAVVVAEGAVTMLAERLPASIPGREAVVSDPFTALAALGLAVVAGIVFGAVAALGASHVERDAPRRAADGVAGQRLQTFVVVAQGALALVLVAGAGLMVRTSQELASAPLGFEPQGTLTFQVRLAEADTSAASARAYADEMEARLAAIPGVVAVGLTDLPPLSFEFGYAVQLRRAGDHDSEPAVAVAMKASGDYFRAAGIPVLEGRPFDRDSGDAAGLIVDERVAAALFPDQVAAGRAIESLRFVDGEPVWIETHVRAVVGRVHAHGARESAYPAVYGDLRQSPAHSFGAVVRVSGEPADLLGEVRTAALAVRATVAPYNVRTLSGAAASLIETDRALAFVGSAFSVVALALAALGLYGLTARQVARRRREYGVRMALGAREGHLVRVAVRRSILLGVAAILFGLPGALAGAGALRSRLFGVEPFDPTIFVVGAAFLLAVVIAAAWVPARRIARVDPREALAG